ncbi:hypothetical protein IKF20_00675 [Candidatus Saccharibacteria bacterium]|nr:hypothetical protein [Candidatus Saccharibacteria bacterium]
MRSHICTEKMALSTFLLGLTIISSALLVEGASAVTYQDSVDVSFTFNPTISINLSSDTASTDLIIDNLAPGSVADSNTLTVSVITNAAYGYYLTATAGTSSTNTDLVNTSNSNYKFTSLAPNADLSTLTTDNTWGYRTSDDNGSTWSNYSGLPKDNNDEGATGKSLIETTSPADNRSIKFKIGAKASTDQASGTYTNIITFYAVTSPEPEPPVGPDPPVTCNTPVPNITYMQEINSSNAATVMSNMTDNAQYYLRDSRDEEPYCVSKIKTKNASEEDQYAIWMTQNLRITGIVNSTNSNFSTHENVNVCEGDLTGGDSYDEARCHDSGNTENGVWYNYAAASAKTILTSNNSTLDTENICPANWTLPSYDTSKPAGSINSLVGSDSVYAFSPVTGGYYRGGSVYVPGNGYWWSTTASSSNYRYYLYYNGSSLGTSSGSSRNFGNYIRCVRASL